MKKLVAMTVVACILGALALAQGTQPKPAAGGGSDVKTEKARVFPGEKGWKLVAYYFHGSFRCQTCLSIEKQSKETVEGDFAKEIKSGKVVFQSLNYEEPENAHFGEDYQLTTRSLVLSLRKNGKEIKWKNLPEIWTRVHNPPSFREYVSGEVKAMQKEMK